MASEELKKLKQKKKYHEKKVKFFNKKIEEQEAKKHRIGFKWYD